MAQIKKNFLRLFFKKEALAFLCLAAAPAQAQSTVSAAQAALGKAQAAAAAHHLAAGAATARARAAAAQAAILAEQQIAAAAALRRLENATGADTAALGRLQDESAAAAASLRSNEAALANLLPVMQRLSAQPAATLLATPGSPNDAVRGALIMQGIAAELEERAAKVKAESHEVFALLGQSQAAQSSLTAALAAQQEAETRLTAQIAAAKATEMAQADMAVSEQAAALAADSTVRDLRAAVARLRASQEAAAILSPPAPLGGGQQPVAGAIVQNFGDATVAGPAVGVSYRAVPGARVVTPCAGPVLFADRFQTYGQLVMVDCGGGYIFVLSGMARLDVSAGQRLARGQPIGEMREAAAPAGKAAPVLYVELRHGGTTVNPGRWLGSG
jgi:septal ring factor EnvC (AmiA/AmiB activator)